MRILTWVLHGSTDPQIDSKLRAGLDSQDIGLASASKGALVAPNIVTVHVRVVADILWRVGREFDRVVRSFAGEFADVFEGRRIGAIGDNRVKEVMSRCHLGDSPEQDGGELHCEGLIYASKAVATERCLPGKGSVENRSNGN